MSQRSDHPLLNRPIYAFTIPLEIVSTLDLRADLNAATSATSTETTSHAPRNGDTDITTSGGDISKTTSCALCDASFANVQEQREHVRSDLHRYNLKQRMHGLRPVDEKEFDKRIEELDESISGSDSSDSDSEDDSEDDANQKGESTLTALLKKQAHLADDVPEELSTRKRKRGAGKPPLLWFTSTQLPQDISLGVYRAIFPNDSISDTSTLVNTLRSKQLMPTAPVKAQQSGESRADEGGVPLPMEMRQKVVKGPHYFLCMIGGGHFAGMIVSLTPSITRKGAIEDRSANVIAHKTFHRYTTRRKQGGSQSANDNSKGNAHSAGSSLRRYNEAALVTDIRSLLAEWKSWIDSAELLFIRATGTTNRRTLFGPYDGQVLSSKDPRIRGFPFATRRATQAELMRSFVELTRVKISSVDELAAARKAAEDAATKAEEQATPKAASSPKPSKPKLSKAEEEALLHTSQLQSLIRRSKAPGLVSYIASNGISPDFEFLPRDRPENHHASTPLHLAASSNSAACVSALLTKAKANPTIRNGEGKTAFEIAGDRSTRDAFRLARAELGEGTFAWDEAGIPSALTKSEAESRARAEKAESEAEKAKELDRRKADLEKIRAEEAEKQDKDREKKFGKGRSVVAKPTTMTAEERRAEEARGMTPEMRMRLERERRARAAEARMGRH